MLAGANTSFNGDVRLPKPCRLLPSIIGSLCLPLLIAACSAGSETVTGEVVARVGSDVITTEEFRLSYSLGFPHSMRGGPPRMAYLERMISERLLALEGYRLGIDESPWVRQRVRSMRAELLVEQVFEREVNDRVTVSEDAVREAAGRQGVRFKLRYLPASNRAEAEELRAVATGLGFEAAAERLRQRDPESGVALSDLESPYLAVHEIDAALLDAVADLEAGRISEPIPFRGAFILVQVVDIRRNAAGGALDPTDRARMEQVQFHLEAKKLAREFVTGTMEPLDVRLKGDAYRRLRRHLWDWHLAAPPDGNLYAGLQPAKGEYADSLRSMLDLVIMTTRDEQWSVERFLRDFPADRYPLSAQDAKSFDSDLYDAFGLTLRDRMFVEIAEREGMDSRPEFRKEMKRWTDKWVYRGLVRAMADTVHVSDSDVREYYVKHLRHYGMEVDFADVQDQVVADAQRAKLQTLLPGQFRRLRQRYPVEVNDRVLAGLALDDPLGVAGPAVTVLKGHTGRPAFPIVDPHW